MEQFIQRHEARIEGVLEGYDRLLLGGTLRFFSNLRGMFKFLSMRSVLLKDFKGFAQSCTRHLADHAQQVALDAGRPYQYLTSSQVSKEALAAQIARRDGITQGLVCVLACVEPCMSFDVQRNRETRHLDLVCRWRKCRFFYFYYLDENFGPMHVRLQSWLPFDVQVCLNGREYLARQLDRAGITYAKADNCFRHLGDLPRAQDLLDGLIHRDWAPTLRRWVAPLLQPLRRPGGVLERVPDYYWTIRQSEYATDVMFRDAAALQGVYPGLCRHAMEQLHSGDVLRFLGHHWARQREVTSDLQRRIEGVRVKHRVGNNSVKMYDKQGSVLRIETTINDPHMFRAWRKAEGKPQSPLAWRKLRKGVADSARRAQVSRDANHRYLQALAVVGDTTATHRVLDPISQPVKKDGHSCRGLRPVNPEDAALFRAVLRGEHLLHGFSNRLLQRTLFDRPTTDPSERRRRSAYVSRQFRLLRHHGLIHKVGRQRLYRITTQGHQAMSVALAVRQADLTQLKVA